jgi:hypothetical protein
VVGKEVPAHVIEGRYKRKVYRINNVFLDMLLLEL